MSALNVTPRLKTLIDECAILWAGEAEVARAYFQSPKRTREGDRAFLARQAFKEVWGSGFTGKNETLVQAWAQQLIDMFEKLDTEVDRHRALELAEGMKAEFEHYCHFADAYDAMAQPGEAKLTPFGIQGLEWKAEAALSEVRRKRRADHGEIGWRAMRFTEGGYCTILAEGAKLCANPHGHEGRDGLIGEACKKVFDDEFLHMLYGIVEVGREPFGDEEWALFRNLVLEQLRLRIPMRNEQFGFPLSEARIADIYAGKIDPLPFDYERARLAA
jgi:hypothetical protein